VLDGTYLAGAVITGANFKGGQNFRNLTKQQLYSTASYQQQNLQGVGFGHNNLSGWDFNGQNLKQAIFEGSFLTDADLHQVTLFNANLTGASLKNAYLSGAVNLASARFSAATVYNQWTVFPARFDPTSTALTLVMSPAGDLDADDALDAADVDILANKIAGREIRTWWLPNAAFDLNGDSSIDLKDHEQRPCNRSRRRPIRGHLCRELYLVHRRLGRGRRFHEQRSCCGTCRRRLRGGTTSGRCSSAGADERSAASDGDSRCRNGAKASVGVSSVMMCTAS
jgi:hypothetical protein